MARTKIGSLFADVTLNTKGLDKGIRTAQRKLRLFGRDATQTGKQLMVGIGTPMAIIGGQAVNVFQNFEQEMAKVKAISGATASEFKALGANARELGATTRFTATNVAELQLVFSKLGFTASEIEKVTGATLNLALATGEDLAESARVSAQTLRGFGLNASEMNRVVDVMGKSFSSSALDLNKFDTAMSVVSATAKSAGLSIEETTSLLAILVDRGVDASSAGTALRNVFLEIAKQGLTLHQALDMIENSSNRNATAMQIFGKRGATVAQIIALNRQEAFGLQAEFENSAGTAKELATIMDDTLQGSLFKLKSAFEGVQLSLATKLAPAFRKLVDRLSELLSENKEVVAQFLVTASKIGALAMAFGAFLFIVGQLAFVLANIVGVFGFVVKAVLLVISPLVLATIAMTKFGQAFAVAGIVAFLKVIVIASVLFGAFREIIKELNDENYTFGDDIALAVGYIITGLEDLIGFLAKAIISLADFGSHVVRAFNPKNIRAMMNDMNMVRDIVREAFPDGDTYKQLSKEHKLALMDATREMQFQFQLGDKISYDNAVRNAIETAREIRRAYDEEFAKSFPKIDGITGAGYHDNAISRMTGGDTGAGESDVSDRTKRADVSDRTKRANDYANRMKGFAGSITGAFDKIKQGDFAGLFDNIGGGVKKVTDLFKDMEVPDELEADLSAIEKRTQSLVESLENEQSLDNITRLYNSFAQGMKSAMQDIKQDTIFTAEEVSGVMKDISNGLTDSLMEFFETGKLNVRNFVQDVLQQLARLQLQKSVVNPFISALGGMLTPSTDTGATTLDNHGGTMPQYVQGMLEGRANGGAVMAGTPYLVGERGMEMFVPKTSGTIVPNDKMGGMGTTIVNFNVQATDANSFDQQIAQREQMLIGMIDKAFHKRGRIGING